MDRRTILKLGAASAAAWVTGCGASPGSHPAAPTTSGPGAGTAPSATSATTGTASTTTGGGVDPWRTLASSLQGRLVRPTDPGYLTDLQLYDSRFDSVRPQAIAYCSSPTDVQRCVGFASEAGLPFAARSGGHSYAGYSTSTGLVIDVTPMNSVKVSAQAGSATVGAGARLIDVYSSLNPAGVSISGGSCPTVGIAGLTLGGGQGVVDRAYGLTCDALTSVTLVTADGRLVDADAETNPDLFWACRGGGGGNFGVATSFVFSTFAPSPTAILAHFTWPWAAAAEVVPAWMEWASSAPDQMWSNLLLETAPGSAEPTVSVGTVWVGAPNGASGPLDQLRRAVGAGPATTYEESVPFGHAMYVEGGCASLSQAACHLPSQNPGGTLTRQPSLAKSAYISELPGDAGVAAIVAGIENRHGSGAAGAAGFDALGGAVNRVDPAATAFVHRQALVSVQLNFPFTPATSAAALAEGQSWLNSWYQALTPYFDGQAYQNYIDADLAGWAGAYYGSNLPRLSRIKRTWDPDGLFRFAQSIPPA